MFCVKYSNVQYQVGSSNYITTSDAQKQMVNLVLDIDFMTSNILKLEFFSSHFLEFIIYSRASSQNFVEIH